LGKGPELSGAGLAMAVVGIGLELAGLGAIGFILWRAGR
jgi:hypothetical protein